ncbi:MAG: class I SAM-dependent methyltransferase [Chloroflexota bacterium]
MQEIVRSELETAIAAAAARGSDVTVLDAGCGRVSALRPFRDRIASFVGADIHAVAPGTLPHLDDFVVADLCRDTDAFAPGSFDVVLSSFTIEHFADPPAAFANFARWLRPGGVLVATTVNRRHPFVWAYLSAPRALRNGVQPLVKATTADAHPIVGVCNSPEAIRSALTGAGFGTIRMSVVGHLARAWSRRLPTYAIGLVGDLAAQAASSRRSTIVVAASKA